MFNVGDIVKCISNGGYGYLECGRQYEVTRVWNDWGDDFIDVRELGSKKSNGGFYPKRFELVTKKNTNVDKY
jgi:hypothetical protein